MTTIGVGAIPEEATRHLATMAKALGHPARVRMLLLLLERASCYCGEIVNELPFAQATVSQLKVLKDAGLIRGTIEGPRVCYSADREQLANLRQLVGDLLVIAAAPSEECCGDQ